MVVVVEGKREREGRGRVVVAVLLQVRMYDNEGDRRGNKTR